MRARVTRGLTAGGSLLLTAAAVLGTLCLVVTVLAPMVGVRPLIFLSGSMSPTIPAGSLALARTVPAEEIEVNDIVTVARDDSYMTHRVVDVTHAPGKATLLLRGDGNTAVDATLYEVTSAPRTEFWVPGVGSVVAWFSRAPGVYVLAGWVAVVLASLRRHRGKRPRDPRPPTGRPKLTLLLARRFGLSDERTAARTPRLGRSAAVVTFAVGAPLVFPSLALAFWADTVQVTGASIRTVTPTAPVASCGAVSGSSITVNWTAVPGATGYRLSHGDQGSPTIEEVSSAVTSRTFTNRVDGRFTVQTRYGTTWISGSSNQLRYDSAGQGSCTG